MQALREKDPSAEFRFWGGDAMSAACGTTPVRHIRDLAIMGFVEVAIHLHTVLGNIAFCKKDIEAYRPDVVVGIDYPGFNLKIEAWAHKHGFRTVHYISPNLWAWKKGRIKGMKKNLDRLCYILPFEEKFFADNDMPQAVYVGHPLIDAIKGKLFNDGLRHKLPTIALLPGSRRQELKHSMPLMVQLANNHPEFHFVVAGMSLLGEEIYNRYIPARSNVEVVYDQTYPLLASAYAAVAKTIVSRRIRYISLVNLIADSTIVTELIQGDFNPTRLEKEFQLITTDDSNRIRMLTQYAHMRDLLSGSGASERTAQAIIDLIK